MAPVSTLEFGLKPSKYLKKINLEEINKPMSVTKTKIFYLIKKPKNKRKSYSILREFRTGSKRTYETLNLESLDSINLGIRNGTSM